MGEMLAAGLPIITGHSIGDVDALVEEYRMGSLIRRESSANFTKAIDDLVHLLATDKIRTVETLPPVCVRLLFPRTRR